ncbi:hypothetical protein [Actinoplanes sp. NPDC026623]|uniref:hypothetical protein n=1 Tax=Actinoplanes sp. NPDC026623 TaxID=3155610 RepID=UPI0033C7F4FA
MEEIRVLLTDLPRMLREILRNLLAAQPEMVVEIADEPRAPLVSAVDRTRAHVVILGQEAPAMPSRCRDLLERRPRVQVMTVSVDGRRICLYGLRPYREPLGEVEPEKLVDTIRGLVVASRAW